MAKRNIPAGLTAIGFQVISLANSTALGLNSTCSAGKSFVVGVETTAARVRFDGTNPALTTGILINTTGSPYTFHVPGASLKFQRTTGTAKVSVQAFKFVGE